MCLESIQYLDRHLADIRQGNKNSSAISSHAYCLVLCCMYNLFYSWWCHDTEMLSVLLALCEGNPSVVSPHKEPVTQALMLAWINFWTNNQVASDWDAMILMWRHFNIVCIHPCMFPCFIFSALSGTSGMYLHDTYWWWHWWWGPIS